MRKRKKKRKELNQKYAENDDDEEVNEENTHTMVVPDSSHKFFLCAMISCQVCYRLRLDQHLPDYTTR